MAANAAALAGPELGALPESAQADVMVRWRGGGHTVSTGRLGRPSPGAQRAARGPRLALPAAPTPAPSASAQFVRFFP